MSKAPTIPRFTIFLVVRLILIIANVLFFATIFQDKGLFFNKLMLFLLFCGQVAELIYAINYTNRELAKLFSAVRYSDFTILFDRKSMGRSFGDLGDSLTEVMHAFRQVKIEKEAQYQFLQRLVNQMNVGVIALHNDEIELINSAALKVLNVNNLRSWKLIKAASPEIVTAIEDLGDGGRKMIEVQQPSATRTLALEVSTMSILGESHKLITFQDINSEVEQKEIEAWHKLIRILTHEIMNSITPVSSLTETMQSMLTAKDGKQKEIEAINEETISDIRFSLQTVQKRSEALMNFVENYRKITRVPKPSLADVEVGAVVISIKVLMKKELTRRNIELSAQFEPGMVVRMDQTLVEQVLINLITNSMHALESRQEKKIAINAYHSDGHPVIEVADNGKGISEKELKEIFVPFFTTREDGSGIGLSLSRQIMSSHGGSIRVNSVEGNGATFFLRFPGRN
jgi:nitrogen fixation/metabolism regulation signal transduction histidine kinase